MNWIDLDEDRIVYLFRVRRNKVYDHAGFWSVYAHSDLDKGKTKIYSCPGVRYGLQTGSPFGPKQENVSCSSSQTLNEPNHRSDISYRTSSTFVTLGFTFNCVSSTPDSSSNEPSAVGCQVYQPNWSINHPTSPDWTIGKPRQGKPSGLQTISLSADSHCSQYGAQPREYLTWRAESGSATSAFGPANLENGKVKGTKSPNSPQKRKKERKDNKPHVSHCLRSHQCCTASTYQPSNSRSTFRLFISPTRRDTAGVKLPEREANQCPNLVPG